MIEFDEHSLPKGFVVAASPGFSQFGQGMEKLTFMGLARKISKASRMGFEFAMIDYESLSEMYEPGISQKVKKMKESENIEVGLHLPITLDLSVASSYVWDVMHDILQRGAYSGKDIMEAKFVLIHASSSLKPGIVFRLGQREYPQKLCSHDGINLGEFMEMVDQGVYNDPVRGKVSLSNGKSLVDWFKGKFIKILYSAMGVPGDIPIITYFDEMAFNDKLFSEAVKYAKDKYEKFMKDSDEYANKKIKEIDDKIDAVKRKIDELRKKSNMTDDEKQKMGELQKEYENLLYEKGRRNHDSLVQEYFENLTPKERSEYTQYLDVVRTTNRFDFDKVFKYWKLNGSNAEESVAYRVIAKYMYLTKDPIWFEIVGNYDPDHIVDADNKVRISNDMKNKGSNEIRNLVDRFILAVSIKYIQGHLFSNYGDRGMKKYGFDGSVYDYLTNNKIRIYFENSPPAKEGEGQLRIMTPNDLISIARMIDDGEWVSAAVDTEHLMSNLFSPEKEFSSIKDGYGRYITMIHINGPRPIHPTHSPIFLYSPDMEIIYKWFYILKKKGMTRGYFVWEMGSFGVMESAIALRKIRDEISKKNPTPPEKLPPEFFGIDEKFEARQAVAMREHAFDPLEGLFMVPEESHTFLSTAAKNKGQLNIWNKEKYS